jgi:hypothetical protein
MRAGIGVQVRDGYGRNVADGTRVHLKVQDGDHGLLAYDQQMLVDGRSQRNEVIVGKAIDLVVRNGYAQLVPNEDPGIENMYLHLLGDIVGDVTLVAEADGKTVNTNDATNGNKKTIHIVRQTWIHLPMVFKGVSISQLPVPKGRH